MAHIVPLDSEMDTSDDEVVYFDTVIEDEDDQDLTATTPGPSNVQTGDIFSTWTSDHVTPTIHDFDNSSSGINVNSGLTSNSTELDFFEHFLNNDIMTKIVDETNKYYKFNMEHAQLSDKSRFKKWTDTTIDELYLFFGLTMLMTRNTRITIAEHWSTDEMLQSDFFGRIMTRDRYQLLLSQLHFSDSYQQRTGDRLIKIRLLLDHARKMFKETMTPTQNLCIDESLTAFQGRLSFKQFIRTKRSRFGIKSFVLCDVESSYILDFIIYVGDQTEITDDHNLGKSGAVVTTLLKDYLNRGHTLWVDNWYSSPQLFHFLHLNKTNACGTVRENRRGMPRFKKLQLGEIEAKHCGPLMALKWRDRRDVHMLSTLHDDSFGPTDKTNRLTGEAIYKPKCVIDYNQNMGAVDKSDMMLSTLSCMRKSLKWYKKMSFHIIDLFLLCSHALYMKASNQKVPLAEFQLQVLNQLFDKHKKLPLPDVHPQPSSSQAQDLNIDSHMPVPISKTGKNIYRKCHVCTHYEKMRKMTRYMCEECDVSLCVYPCFKTFHQKFRQ